jgi:lysophospholipid acyltransferase (LPLAT)-like uncharacterized protein
MSQTMIAPGRWLPLRRSLARPRSSLGDNCYYLLLCLTHASGCNSAAGLNAARRVIASPTEIDLSGGVPYHDRLLSHLWMLASAAQLMKVRSAFGNWLLAGTIVFFSRLLFRTLRIRVVAADPTTSPYLTDTTESFIYCVWHDSVAFPMFAGKHVRTVALVSKHQDGSCLASGLQMLNMGLVRGSSSRDGANAMREMLRLPAGKHVVVTPDGPRGPRRRIKQGLIFLASHSGRSVVPTAFAATRSWALRGSWTNLIIPKPFSTAFALTGKPIAVPSGLDREGLKLFEAKVQDEMDRLAQLAEAWSTSPSRTIDEIAIHAQVLRRAG